jgi:23S rRNA (cytosine1962-C5)-methyltransferase
MEVKMVKFGDSYELLDSGNFKKLERFGSYILDRPEPQALWKPTLSESEWKAKASAIFTRDRNNPEKGNWQLGSRMVEQWKIPYAGDDFTIQFRLGLSGFKHVGLFPEQAYNWDYIYSMVQKRANASVLNLFAYTGGASLAARAGGAEVTHVDSVKPVITWARENMELCGQQDIRWVVEDALKFAKREQRRNKTYTGIILDPPAYGRGADGEKWVLEEHLPEMLETCAALLDPKGHFLILNLYSMGFSPVLIETLLNTYFGKVASECGELGFEDPFGKKLPLGIYGRFSRGL